MLVTTNLRNWGIGSEPDTMLECAAYAESAGIDTIWVNERLSTPPGMGRAADDGGRYLDCLMALTFIAARTEIIAMKTQPLEDADAAMDMAAAFAAAGCDEFVHAGGYADAAAYRHRIDVLAERIIPAVA